jgi:hypothetical protein
LRHRRRATHFTENQYLDLEVAALVFHMQQIASSDLAHGLGRLPVGQNPTKFTGPSRQRARLEETRCPEPFVHPHTGHYFILVPGGNF